MLVRIEIQCNTAAQLEQHLKDIAETVKIRSRNNPDCTFEVGTAFEAMNNIGNHDVTIQPD